MMAIRIRVIEGETIALCAVETDAKEGDLYLDDAAHYALATKFADDFKTGGADPRLLHLMRAEKKRDAQETLERDLSNLPERVSCSQ